MISDFGGGGRADIFSFYSKMGDEKLVIIFLIFSYHMALEKQDVWCIQIFITKFKKCFVNTFPLPMLEYTLSGHILNLILQRNFL